MQKEKAPAFAGTLSDNSTLPFFSNNRRLDKAEIIDALIIIFFPASEFEPGEISRMRSNHQNVISAAASLYRLGFPPIIDAADFFIYQFRGVSL